MSANSPKIPPNSRRLVEALRSIGYSFEGAVADLIDNSITARANRVLVRFVRVDGEVSAVHIVDDGIGMPRERLQEAMRFGADTDQTPDSLSKFGMGMKIASLSQAGSLTVASRSAGDDSAMRWTVEGIAADWTCDRLSPVEATALLDADRGTLRLKRHGTVIVWEHLDRLKIPRGASDPVDRLVNRLRRHLGLHLHRFLEKGLTISIDVFEGSSDTIPREVEPLNPFAYDVDASPFKERCFDLELSGIGNVELGGHIWPPDSTSKNYRLDDAARRQGIYFYRNDRLIQAGGWNGWRQDAEPHLSLARVAIDLPTALDGNFALDVQKSSVKVPAGFADALERAKDASGFTFKQYVKEAQKAYRKQERKDPTNHPLVPGTGLESSAREKLREILAPDELRVREVSIEWADVDGGRFFALDYDNKKILLNRQYRHRVLQGRKATATDAPLEKLFLFLLFRYDLDRKVIPEKHQKYLDQVDAALRAAMKRDER